MLENVAFLCPFFAFLFASRRLFRFFFLFPSSCAPENIFGTHVYESYERKFRMTSGSD